MAVNWNGFKNSGLIYPTKTISFDSYKNASSLVVLNSDYYGSISKSELIEWLEASLIGDVSMYRYEHLYEKKKVAGWWEALDTAHCCLVFSNNEDIINFKLTYHEIIKEHALLDYKPDVEKYKKGIFSAEELEKIKKRR